MSLTSENKGSLVFVWAKDCPLWVWRRVANVVHQVLRNMFVRQRKVRKNQIRFPKPLIGVNLNDQKIWRWVVYLSWVLLDELLCSMGLQRKEFRSWCAVDCKQYAMLNIHLSARNWSSETHSCHCSLPFLHKGLFNPGMDHHKETSCTAQRRIFTKSAYHIPTHL